MVQKFCLALDLKDDPKLIEEYERYHRNVWDDIKKSIRDAGITDMQIYRTGTRLFMIIEATDDFSFENKAVMDDNNPRVQEWERLMWRFQQPIPWAKQGQKWVLMDRIFALNP